MKKRKVPVHSVQLCIRGVKEVLGGARAEAWVGGGREGTVLVVSLPTRGSVLAYYSPVSWYLGVLVSWYLGVQIS